MESLTEKFVYSPVAPVRPPAGYIGGKRALAKRLVAMIDSIDHHLYAEPFVGMGGVFFRRRRRPKCEVINDISADVATLFRILQRHYQPFVDMLKWRFSSRDDFERLSDLLAGIEGSFVLSINDTPAMRAAFSRFAVQEVEVTYRLSGQSTGARELIITGPRAGSE